MPTRGAVSLGLVTSTCRTRCGSNDTFCGANHEKKSKVTILASSIRIVSIFTHVHGILDDVSTPRRNEPCPCGSGKKYKHCYVEDTCGLRTSTTGRSRAPIIIVGLGTVVGLVIMGTSDVQIGLGTIGGGIVLALGYFVFKDPPAPKGGGDPGAINFGG